MLQRLVWRLMRARRLVALTRWPAQYRSKIADLACGPIVDGAVVFFGSSSIRLWGTLAADLAPLPVVNAGFGGGHAVHLRLFWRQLLPRHRPRAVVVYAGDNDLAAGVSVDDVVTDLDGFVDDLAGLCPVVLLLVKRSPQREHIAAQIDALNARLRERRGRPGIAAVVDVDAPLRGKDGRPDRALFQWDGLHLAPAGYARWTAAVKPVLTDLLK